MSRHSRRERRTARFWADKIAGADGDPARVAAVKWDQTRAAIEKRGATAQAAAYAALGQLLDDFQPAAGRYVAVEGDPARVAAVKWDQTRAGVKEGEAVAETYGVLGGLLDDFRNALPAVTHSEVHSSQFTLRLPWKR